MPTSRDVERDTAALVSAVVLVCAVLTVALTFLPFVRFSFRASALHVSLETANAMVALLVAFLVHGRYRSSRRLQDLLLTVALCTMALANLALTALPTALATGSDGTPTDRAATAVRLLAVALLAAAAVVPRRVLVHPRLVVPGAAGAAALVAGTTLLAVAAAPASPAAQLPGHGSLPLVSDPVFVGAQVLGGVLLAVAATALTAKTVRSGDELLRWLAAACAVGVFARFHYGLYPSLYSEYVFSGDLLRLGCYTLMLVGAAREIRSYRPAAGPPAATGSPGRATTSSRGPSA